MQYHPRYLLSSVEVSPKQYWVAVNHRDRIRLIDTFNSSSPILHDLVGHSGDVECFAWCPWYDYLLASGGQDKTIRVRFSNRSSFDCILLFELVMEC